MEIRRGLGGDIYFYDNDGNLYDVFHNNKIEPIQKEDFRPFHPMCRCIMLKPEDAYFTYCTGWFVWKYKEECKESLIWIN